MPREFETRPEKEVAKVEDEREIQYVEVGKEELRKLGWVYYKRMDGHVFTVVIPQGMDSGAAFERNWVFARHQMKDKTGSDFLPGVHHDHLKEDRIGSGVIMSTDYDPTVGHTDYTVLKKI